MQAELLMHSRSPWLALVGRRDVEGDDQNEPLHTEMTFRPLGRGEPVGVLTLSHEEVKGQNDLPSAEWVQMI